MKTQAQYTQGQWIVEYTKGVSLYKFIQEFRLVSDSPIGEDRLQANARLIAAAPELLEALEMAYEAMSKSEDADGFDPKVFSKIESAIKKSKGE